jgi:hypothetical protein
VPAACDCGPTSFRNTVHAPVNVYNEYNDIDYINAVNPPCDCEDRTFVVPIEEPVPVPIEVPVPIDRPLCTCDRIGAAVDIPVDEHGFKYATSLCNPMWMEKFFTCMLGCAGYDGCSQPHIQGLVHWFTCVPAMDFQYVLDTIYNGRPCKVWTKKGSRCPSLTPECGGHYCR